MKITDEMSGRGKGIDNTQDERRLGDDDETRTGHGRRDTKMNGYRYEDVEGSFRKFSGNETQNIVEWISMFDQMCTRTNWSDFEKLIYIRRSVTDEVYEHLFLDDDDDYETAKKVLLREYGGMWTQAAAVKRLLTRKKGRDESARQYVLDMRRLGRAARLNDPCVAQFILDGLDLDRKMKVALHGITDMTKLREMIERAEEYEIEMMAKVLPNQYEETGRHDAKKKSIGIEWTSKDRNVKRSNDDQYRKRGWNNTPKNVACSDGGKSFTGGGPRLDKSDCSESQIIVVDVSSKRGRIEDDNGMVVENKRWEWIDGGVKIKSDKFAKDFTIRKRDDNAEIHGIPKEDDKFDENMHQLNDKKIAVNMDNVFITFERHEKEAHDDCLNSMKDYGTTIATNYDERDDQERRDFQDDQCVATVNENTEEHLLVEESHVTVIQRGDAEKKCCQSDVRERGECWIDPSKVEEIELFVDAASDDSVVTDDDVWLVPKDLQGSGCARIPVEDGIVLGVSERRLIDGVIDVSKYDVMVMVERSDKDMEHVHVVGAKMAGERHWGEYQDKIIVEPIVEGIVDEPTMDVKGQTNGHGKDTLRSCTEERCCRSGGVEVIDSKGAEDVELYMDATDGDGIVSIDEGWHDGVDLEASGAMSNHEAGERSELKQDEESWFSANWINALRRQLYGDCEWISNIGGRGTIVC